jgi:hypothetical protein
VRNPIGSEADAFRVLVYCIVIVAVIVVVALVLRAL